MKNFIEASELKEIKKTVIIDIRTGEDHKSHREVYDEGHLSGAYFVDLDMDITGKVTETTGAHPLPELEDFHKLLESMGATEDSTFIIYDSGDNYSAPRMWFLLKYFGVENAFVVNGGFKAIQKSGLKLTKEPSVKKQGNISLSKRPELLAFYEEVLSYSQNPENHKVIIDSRAKDRYLGLTEPIYEKAGHIPHAKSYFYGDNYLEDGTVKDKKLLDKRFKSLKDKDLIVSCGSGVTACANIIAIDEIGLNPRLYSGSYSQWIKMGNDVNVTEE